MHTLTTELLILAVSAALSLSGLVMMLRAKRLNKLALARLSRARLNEGRARTEAVAAAVAAMTSTGGHDDA